MSQRLAKKPTQQVKSFWRNCCNAGKVNTKNQMLSQNGSIKPCGAASFCDIFGINENRVQKKWHSVQTVDKKLSFRFRIGTCKKPPQPFKILRRVVIQHGSAIRDIQFGQDASAAFHCAAQTARTVIGHQHGNERSVQNDGVSGFSVIHGSHEVPGERKQVANGLRRNQRHIGGGDEDAVGVSM